MSSLLDTTTEEREALERGWSSWFTRKDVRRAFRMVVASVVLHGILLVVLTLLNFRTGILELEIEWSEDPLVGVGTASTAYVHPEGRKEARGLAKSEPEPKDPEPVEKKKIEPVLEKEPPPEEDAPAEADVQEPPQPREEEPEPSPPPRQQERVAKASPVKPEKKEPVVEKKKPAKPVKVKRKGGLLSRGKGLFSGAKVSDKVADPLEGEEKAQLVAAAQQVPGLAEFGPGNARLIVLLRMDRLRDSPFEEGLKQLMHRFPDYKKLLSGSAIEPVRGIDRLLIATNNPKRRDQTFVAVHHPIPDKELREALSASFHGGLRWYRFKGRPLGRPLHQDTKKSDPRVVLLPEPGVFMLMRPEILAQLDSPSVTPPPVDEGAEEPETPVEQRTLLQAVTAIEETDGPDGEAPAVFVTARDVSLRFAPGIAHMPNPVAVSVALGVGAEPSFVMWFEFDEEAKAQEFVKRWPLFVESIADLGLPGLEGVMLSIAIAREGTTVYARGRVQGPMIQLLLSLGTSMLPE